MASLPGDLPACVLVTLHIPPDARSRLPRILARAGRLPAEHARDDAPLEPGRVVVAPPDRHLLVVEGRVRLSAGPHINRHRPAVDAMLGSIAREAGPRAVAVILSGSLDDGAVGANLLRRRGGRVLVQDPQDAIFPSMPRAALAAVPDALVAASAALGGAVVTTLARMSEAVGATTNHETGTSMSDADDPGFLSTDETRLTRLACPDCGGGLAEVDLGDISYFRCHVGHRYSPQALEAAQRDSAERKLWAAAAALEEHAVLARHLAARSSSGEEANGRYHEAAAEAAETARMLTGRLRGRSEDPVRPEDR
jgi:two-component system, chemotaxis family, protein-glutamate methylesterase/glutaminase